MGRNLPRGAQQSSPRTRSWLWWPDTPRYPPVHRLLPPRSRWDVRAVLGHLTSFLIVSSLLRSPCIPPLPVPPSPNSLSRPSMLLAQQGEYVSGSNCVLMEASLLTGEDTEASEPQRSAAILRWLSAYEAMRTEAMQMGIPGSAVPGLPENPTADDIRSARKLLSGIIASFLSANI